MRLHDLSRKDPHHVQVHVVPDQRARLPDVDRRVLLVARQHPHRDVAVQVEFESKEFFKPVFHIIGSRLKPGAVKPMGQMHLGQNLN
jgi:hypothetical protein